MAGRLEGKVAIITGGASGMGLATVRRFLAEGARVVIADLNDATGKEALELAGQDGAADRVRFLRTDVSEEVDIEAVVALALRDFGRLDCMFNNAGIGGVIGPITDLRVEDWDFTFAVLVRGVFLGVKHAARAMIEQGEGGSIINTASVAGLSGGGGPVCYSAAKAAVVNMGMGSAMDLAEHKIRVNTICPGGILTPLIHRGAPDAMRDRLRKLQPWPEVGEGEHIAGAALFLASEDSRFVTGESLTVDGGLTAAGPSLNQRLRDGDQPSQLTQLIQAGNTVLDRGSTGEPTLLRKNDE